MSIQDFYTFSLEHQKSHRKDCGAIPYAFGDSLTSLVAKRRPANILEVGTGIGYSTVCLALGNPDSKIHTIDKNPTHIKIAQKFFKEFALDNQIITHTGTAEDILPTLHQKFDFIFYDGFIPQRKFVFQFYNMLLQNGILVTTNLFLADKTGGKYLKMLLDPIIWQTELEEDTAFSVKK